MALTKKHFGTLSDGQDVSIYCLSAGAFEATVSSYGANWLSFIAPSAAGHKRRDDLLLGFSGLEGYMHNEPYLGATIGRYANRIAGARFDPVEHAHVALALVAEGGVGGRVGLAQIDGDAQPLRVLVHQLR
ncbi:MAG: hypothetical protein LLF89_01155, partial [Spirochaetaceae bacterium]|nr:hypothetical protein [Spirochaetaceae bacterium]